jgi:superfamily II DNA/RNA helicase
VIRNVGGPLGVRAALAAGVAGSSGLQNELANMQREAVQVLVGTPAKVLEVMTTRGGLQGGEVKTLIVSPRHAVVS